MKTFRFTMPQPRASAVEELNRERYVAQHKKDSPEPNLYVSGGFHFILALFFLVFGLYIYYTGLPEFGFGMYITGLITISQAFSEYRRARKHARNAPETSSEQLAGKSADNWE